MNAIIKMANDFVFKGTVVDKSAFSTDEAAVFNLTVNNLRAEKKQRDFNRKKFFVESCVAIEKDPAFGTNGKAVVKLLKDSQLKVADWESAIKFVKKYLTNKRFDHAYNAFYDLPGSDKATNKTPYYDVLAKYRLMWRFGSDSRTILYKVEEAMNLVYDVRDLLCINLTSSGVSIGERMNMKAESVKVAETAAETVSKEEKAEKVTH